MRTFGPRATKIGCICGRKEVEPTKNKTTALDSFGRSWRKLEFFFRTFMTLFFALAMGQHRLFEGTEFGNSIMDKCPFWWVKKCVGFMSLQQASLRNVPLGTVLSLRDHTEGLVLVMLDIYHSKPCSTVPVRICFPPLFSS